MPFNPDAVKAGDPIRAADVNAQNDEIRRLGQVRCGAGLDARSGAGGLQVALVSPEVIYLKLTSTAGTNNAYAWKEVYHQAPNTWTDATRTGSTSTDPAYPISGDATLSVDGKVWEARRGPTSGQWLFE